MESTRSGIVFKVMMSLLLLVCGGCKGDAHAAGKDGKDAANADRVVTVAAVPVERRDMPIYLDGLGNVVASQTVTVRAQVDGRLDRVAFKEGQEVKKGDLLAQIDPRPFQNQRNGADAALARDRAQLAGAVKNLQRYTEMLKEGLASQQQVDDQRALVAQYEATTRADQATIDSANLSLDYARVTSPIDGVTGVRLVDAGNVVHAADPNGLVVITTLDPIAVIFTLPQDDLPRISKQLAEGPITIEARSRDGTALLATGQLALVDNQINQATATIRLKAMFPNPGRALWPNQFVKTRLLLAVRKNALVVPAAVVQRGPQGLFAYGIADGKAVVRPIQTEGTEGDFAVVTSGLDAGEQVVVDGQNQLKPGSKVTTRDASAAGSATPAASGAPATPSGTGHAGRPGKEGKGHDDGAKR